MKGGPASPETKNMPLHKKNPEVGTKTTVFSDTVMVEQEDAKTFAENEEVSKTFLTLMKQILLINVQITLMDWGNAIIRAITKDEAGNITSIDADLHLEGDFKATDKKITWLAQATPGHALAQVRLLDYDYLITKPKLEKDDAVADFANPNTEFSVVASADANVFRLKERDIIQFERKGYFILDKVIAEGTDAESKRLEFIRIPDGRAAGLALKSGSAPSTGGAEKGKAKSAQTPKDAASLSANPAADPTIKMYEVKSSSQIEKIDVPTSMYRVKSVYEDDD